MSFIESPRFPDDIAYGAVGGPGYSTDVVVVASGYEKRNQNWASARRRYEVAYIRNQTQMDALVAFFHAAAGKANGFRLKDHADYTVAVSAGRIGSAAIGDGTPGPFQLVKRYTSGANTTDRAVQKPVTATLYKGGAAQTAGVHYTLDSATGLVTWLAVASQSITGHTVGAAHQFTTASDIPGLVIGEKVYITGVTGTGAATLNGKAHSISNKTGAGPYTWTISTVTTGLTASGGAAAEYPQAGESLTWAGEFDVAVRFDTDDLRAQMLQSGPANRLYQVSGLSLVEIRL